MKTTLKTLRQIIKEEVDNISLHSRDNRLINELMNIVSESSDGKLLATQAYQALTGASFEDSSRRVNYWIGITNTKLPPK